MTIYLSLYISTSIYLYIYLSVCFYLSLHIFLFLFLHFYQSLSQTHTHVWPPSSFDLINMFSCVFLRCGPHGPEDACHGRAGGHTTHPRGTLAVYDIQHFYYISFCHTMLDWIQLCHALFYTFMYRRILRYNRVICTELYHSVMNCSVLYILLC